MSTMRTGLAALGRPSKITTIQNTSAITLTWNKVNGADGYQVYYKVGNGSYKLYKTYGSAQQVGSCLL